MRLKHELLLFAILTRRLELSIPFLEILVVKAWRKRDVELLINFALKAVSLV